MGLRRGRARRPTVAHCCAADVPIALLRGAGAGGVSVDLAVLAGRGLRRAGDRARRGRPGPARSGAVDAATQPPATKAAVERVRRLLDMLGFDPAEVADQLVLTPACGLAGATPSYARAALRRVREAAAELG